MFEDHFFIAFLGIWICLVMLGLPTLFSNNLPKIESTTDTINTDIVINIESDKPNKPVDNLSEANKLINDYKNLVDEMLSEGAKIRLLAKDAQIEALNLQKAYRSHLIDIRNLIVKAAKENPNLMQISLLFEIMDITEDTRYKLKI